MLLNIALALSTRAPHPSEVTTTHAQNISSRALYWAYRDEKAVLTAVSRVGRLDNHFHLSFGPGLWIDTALDVVLKRKLHTRNVVLSLGAGSLGKRSRRRWGWVVGVGHGRGVGVRVWEDTTRESTLDVEIQMQVQGQGYDVDVDIDMQMQVRVQGLG